MDFFVAGCLSQQIIDKKWITNRVNPWKTLYYINMIKIQNLGIFVQYKWLGAINLKAFNITYWMEYTADLNVLNSQLSQSNYTKPA